jgi:peptidoglycan/xylan/chitin deacetylase (PgdA/CDA1 family)
MKDLVKAALCALYKYSGAQRVQESLRQRTGRPFLVVLLFHRVTDEIPADSLTVITARFRQICRMLRDRFRVVPLGEIFRLLRSRAPLPPRTVAITFDDCYRDNLSAARILAEFDLPACFFVPTAYVGTARRFEWARALRPMPNLSWDDVRAMARMGFEVGSHTVTHANMAAVSPEQARRELVESRITLEAQLGRPVRWFAYPFGGREHFRPELLPLVEEAGYEGVLSGFGGFAYRDSPDPIVPRENVPSFGSNLNLELHLTGCLDWLYALKRQVGLMPAAAAARRRPCACRHEARMTDD